MRRVPLLGLLVFLAVSPMWGQSPPRDLKLLGDHWTAWDPPAAIEEGAEVYLIQRGRIGTRRSSKIPTAST